MPTKPPPPPSQSAPPQRDAQGRFLPGHQFSVGNPGGPGGNPYPSEGKPPMFKTPEELWAKFEEYCAATDAAPWQEEKLFSTKTGVVRANANKKQPYTMASFLEFAGCSDRAWRDWRKLREDLQPVIERIERIVTDQKYKGAAMGFFNANIIARDLGLADRIQAQVAVEQAAPKVDPRKVANRVHPDCTPQMLARIHKAGLQPPLYSQEQLDAGFPFIPPKGLPDE